MNRQRTHRRRAILDFRKGQTADIGMRDVAEEIHNYGVKPDAVLSLLQDALADEQQYRLLLVAAIEKLQARVDAMRDDLWRWLFVLSLGVLVLMLAALVALGIALVML